MSAYMNRHAYDYSRGEIAARGFTLIELMVAITLGILVSVGLVTVFDAVSTNNKVQQSMAEMQENGRYAVTRINDDLRLAYRQLANTTGYSGLQTPGANGSVNLGVAPDVYVKTGIPFPDGTVTSPTGWKNTTSHWPLSPTYFITGTAPSWMPATGTTDQLRVQGSDVVTMRYLNSEGWSSYNNEVRFDCTGAFLNSVIVTPLTTPAAYKSPGANFATGSLALLTSTSGDESIFPVTAAGSATSQTLTPLAASLIHATDRVRCPGSGEVKLFNFTTDFITVTYWLKVVVDPQNASRFIPTLVRTQGDNSVAPPPAIASQELVQGVERMTIKYGAQRADGQVEYVPAATVTSDSSSATCPAPPLSFSDSAFFTNVPRYETGCLWRAVKSVEAHILVNSINDLFTLGHDEWTYQYDGSGLIAPASTTTVMPSGLKAGSMMRREFVTLVSVRNYNN